MKHTLVTFIADIDSRQRSTLDPLMATIRADPAQNSLIPFGQIKSVHYASFSIFENELGKPQDTLVLEVNCDNDIEALLGEMWRYGQVGLQAVFECCEGYSSKSPGFSALRTFLLEKMQQPNAWHIGNVGLTLARIRQEQQLHRDLEAHLDHLRATKKLPTNPAAIYKELTRFVGEKHPWALKNEPRQTRRDELLPVIRYKGFLAAAATLFICGWRATIPALLLGVGALRWHEMRDDRETPPPLNPQRQAAQEAAEYAQGQNHLSSLVRVRPGIFRRLLLRAVLFVVNLEARTETRGQLGSISSIHFAHWSLIDGGRRLLFVSNYDNSWGSYLDDFTDKANIGLTIIWTNTRWFPPTRFLAYDGAAAGARFKTWARLSQEPSQVYYRAYPELSVGNIERNSAIRQGLSQNLQGWALTSWLSLF